MDESLHEMEHHSVRPGTDWNAIRRPRQSISLIRKDGGDVQYQSAVRKWLS